MAQWIYFLHAPRDNFAATMTADEQAVFGAHFQHLQKLLDDGALIVAGPTLGATNTGICIFEADDEAAATAIMNADPVVAGGIAAGELRGFNAAYVRSS